MCGVKKSNQKKTPPRRHARAVRGFAIAAGIFGRHILVPSGQLLSMPDAHRARRPSGFTRVAGRASGAPVERKSKLSRTVYDQ